MGIIHQCSNIHLGICDVEGISDYKLYSDGSYSRLYPGGKSVAIPFQSNDTISMTVDLINYKLSYNINGNTLIEHHDEIAKDKQYKIAIMTFGQPNKIQID